MNHKKKIKEKLFWKIFSQDPLQETWKIPQRHQPNLPRSSPQDFLEKKNRHVHQMVVAKYESFSIHGNPIKESFFAGVLTPFGER